MLESRMGEKRCTSWIRHSWIAIQARADWLSGSQGQAREERNSNRFGGHMSTRRSKPFDNQWSSDPAADDIEPLHPAVAGAMADALVAIAGKDPATGDQEAPPHKPRAIKLDFEFSADDKATIGLAIMLHHAINRRL